MKTINRAKEMPVDAIWLVLNSHGYAYTSRFKNEPVLHRDIGLGCSNNWQSCPSKDGYCKNWKKSLRKIKDKSVKKNTVRKLKSEIKKRNELLIEAINVFTIENVQQEKLYQDIVSLLNGHLSKPENKS